MPVEHLGGDTWVGGLRRKSLCHSPSVYMLEGYKGETGWGTGAGLLEGASWKDTSEQKMPWLTRISKEGRAERECVQSQGRVRGQTLSSCGELTYCRGEDKPWLMRSGRGRRGKVAGKDYGQNE